MLRSPYTPEEVTGLVESWQLMQPYRAKLMFLVRLLDLDVAFSKLPLDIRRAVLLMGYAQLSSRQAGLLLDVSYSTVARRYRRGLESLTMLMNGMDPVEASA